MLSLAAECRKPSMRWRNCLKITGIFLALLIGFSILMTGCGGGGGGDTASTLDPEQLEVAAIVDSFAAAVRAEDSRVLSVADYNFCDCMKVSKLISVKRNHRFASARNLE